MNTTLHNIVIFVITFGLQFAIADKLTVGEWAITTVMVGITYIAGLYRGLRS